MDYKMLNWGHIFLWKYNLVEIYFRINSTGRNAREISMNNILQKYISTSIYFYQKNSTDIYFNEKNSAKLDFYHINSTDIYLYKIYSIYLG